MVQTGGIISVFLRDSENAGIQDLVLPERNKLTNLLGTLPIHVS